MKRDFPELAYLKEKVEKEFGQKPLTSSDFDNLSSSLESSTGQHISSSTLKRLWGYVKPSPMPRQITLNILSVYVGYDSYQDFCKSLHSSDVFSSLFFSSETLMADDLKEGDEVTIGWAPDRVVVLRYSGNMRFEVLDGGSSHLLKGDSFCKSEFFLGKPLYIGQVIRDGSVVAAYVAGKAGGLNLLKVSSKS